MHVLYDFPILWRSDDYTRLTPSPFYILLLSLSIIVHRQGARVIPLQRCRTSNTVVMRKGTYLFTFYCFGLSLFFLWALLPFHPRCCCRSPSSSTEWNIQLLNSQNSPVHPRAYGAIFLLAYIFYGCVPYALKLYILFIHIYGVYAHALVVLFLFYYYMFPFCARIIICILYRHVMAP